MFLQEGFENSITVINISGVTNHLEKLISRGIAVANTKTVQKVIFLFNITVNHFLWNFKQFFSSFNYSESKYNDDIYQANQKQWKKIVLSVELIDIVNNDRADRDAQE